MRLIVIIVGAALISASPGFSQRPEPVDSLTATVNMEDAQRFTSLLRRTLNRPTAAQLEQEYLSPGSYGVTVFTPGRIVNAQRLADAINRNTLRYTDAVDRCLPWAAEMTGDLRSIYLALKGVFPDARLPQIYVVIGADNSGGTAEAGAQVLGLEVLCRLSPTKAAFRTVMRRFFAHETVHALQQDAGLRDDPTSLLKQVLVEGAADFISQLVTGEEPDVARAEWARPREDALWQSFMRDVELTKQPRKRGLPPSNNLEKDALKRWVGNFNNAPPGWPNELGYWIGLRIWEKRYAASTDKRSVLREMLSVTDPEAILRSAGAAS